MSRTTEVVTETGSATYYDLDDEQRRRVHATAEFPDTDIVVVETRDEDR